MSATIFATIRLADILATWYFSCIMYLTAQLYTLNYTFFLHLFIIVRRVFDYVCNFFIFTMNTNS